MLCCQCNLSSNGRAQWGYDNGCRQCLRPGRLSNAPQHQLPCGCKCAHPEGGHAQHPGWPSAARPVAVTPIPPERQICAATWKLGPPCAHAASFARSAIVPRVSCECHMPRHTPCCLPCGGGILWHVLGRKASVAAATAGRLGEPYHQSGTYCFAGCTRCFASCTCCFTGCTRCFAGCTCCFASWECDPEGTRVVGVTDPEAASVTKSRSDLPSFHARHCTCAASATFNTMFIFLFPKKFFRVRMPCIRKRGFTTAITSINCHMHTVPTAITTIVIATCFKCRMPGICRRGFGISIDRTISVEYVDSGVFIATNTTTLTTSVFPTFYHCQMLRFNIRRFHVIITRTACQ